MEHERAVMPEPNGEQRMDDPNNTDKFSNPNYDSQAVINGADGDVYYGSSARTSNAKRSVYSVRSGSYGFQAYVRAQSGQIAMSAPLTKEQAIAYVIQIAKELDDVTIHEEDILFEEIRR